MFVKNRKSNLIRSVVACCVVFSMSVMLTGCNLFDNHWWRLRSSFEGRDAIIQTYDVDGNIMDQVVGRSIDVRSERQFNRHNSDGDITSASAVLNITVGGHSMYHVGSTLLMYDSELVNYFDEYTEYVDIENFERSTPFINRLANHFANVFDGQAMLILIRSQEGKPVATFVGNNVSIFDAGDIDKATGIVIDGRYIFVYRCDYTMYGLDLLR